MRVLIVSQYFWPETFIINDLVRHLVDLGHDITVFTGKPNYPDGKVFEGYTEQGVLEEIFLDKVRVFRIPLRARREGGAKNLILNYLSFVTSGIRWFPSFVRKERFDAIFVFGTSPITSAIPAIPLKFKCRSHLVIWIQDLWPESLSATGFVKNSFLLTCVGLLVRAIYFFADTLLIQSRAFTGQVEKYSDPRKLVYYPNSVDVASLASDGGVLPDEIDQVLRDFFCLVFAGNVGTAQSIETIVGAAQQLQDIPDLRFVIVGSGSRLDWLRQEIKEKELKNIVLAGRYPMSMMSKFYSHAKALVVTLKNEEIFNRTIPSKIQAYMASGRPILAAINGEGGKVICEAGGGMVSSAEDATAFADTIRAFYELSPDVREAMGRAAKTFFDKNFDMRAQAENLIAILKHRIEASGSER